MRCYDCGHNNPDNLGQCQVCGTFLQSYTDTNSGLLTENRSSWQVSPIPSGESLPESNPWPNSLPLSQSNSVNANSLTSRRAESISSSASQASQQRADITGRVIAMENPILESPDIDICRIITKTLMLLLLVVSPLILLHAILTTLGGFSAILALVGLFFFARFLSPTNLFTLYHLSVLANPFGRGNGGEQVPVRYLRVRGYDDEAEYVVRMKGVLTLGNLMPDDLVSFWGQWRRGVLHARYAYSHRTQAWVEFQHSYSWLTLTITVCIVLLLIGYSYGPVSNLFARVQELGIIQ